MLNTTAIDTYVQDVLAPQLARFGVHPRASGRVTRDVGHRLASLVSRWNDLPFRSTVLLTGLEEATFYQPQAAPLDVRALVVLGVRNSLLEDLASTEAAARCMGHVHALIPDRAMPAITGHAIRFFAALDLAAVARQTAAPPAESELFGHLPSAYPRAWTALTQLAGSATREAMYEPVEGEAPHLHLTADHPQPAQPALPVLVLSGMDPEVDPALQSVLHEIATGKIHHFYSETFKGITRHPEKLYRVLDFVLAHQAAVVTLNYFLSNGYVAHRDHLLRPPHNVSEGRLRLQQRAGLARRHWDVLRNITY